MTLDQPRDPASDAEPAQVLLWTFLGFIVYVLVGFGSIFVLAAVERVLLAPFGIYSEAGTASLSIRNALHPVAWGVVVALVAAESRSRLVPGARFGLRSHVVLVIGLVLASVTTLLVEEFVRARYGYFDPEYTGLSLFGGPALVAVALAAWAAMSVPRCRRGPLLVAATLSVIGIGASLLPSLPGAADGIPAASVPIAVVFVVDGCFALGALGLAWLVDPPGS